MITVLPQSALITPFHLSKIVMFEDAVVLDTKNPAASEPQRDFYVSVFINLSSILPNFHRSIENSEILIEKMCHIERSRNEVLTG